MMRLQRCTSCGRAQYPAREICGNCLAETLVFDSADALPGQVLARTRLHHSNEAAMRPLLPLWVGLVRFDAGPVALCFLPQATPAGTPVQVRLGANGLLEAA